jgi:phage tail protein X
MRHNNDDDGRSQHTRKSVPETYYTVQPGDTFHTLAQLCYRDRNKWINIRQANPPIHGIEPDRPLPAGHQLTIPSISDLTTTIVTEEGDTLHALATFFYFSEGQWTSILQANPALQGVGPDQPLTAGLQVTLPFIPERTIIVVTNAGDTLQTLAQTFYNDQNQWVRFGEENTTLLDVGVQALPGGLLLTLPFIPKIDVAILTGEGDTLRALAEFFYGDENKWPRIRQINPALQGVGLDQPLPVGMLLTIPSFVATRIIITEQGDTLRALAQTYYNDAGQWVRVRQTNPPLQGFGPDQPLPAGLQVALKSFPTLFRSIHTGNNDTFLTLAQTFYHDVNQWSVIRQANLHFQRFGPNQILPARISLTIP